MMTATNEPLSKNAKEKEEDVRIYSCKNVVCLQTAKRKAHELAHIECTGYEVALSNKVYLIIGEHCDFCKICKHD